MPSTRHVLTILAVQDLAASTRFYQRAFGWEQSVSAGPYAEFELPGGMRLGLYEREGFARNTGRPPSVAARGQSTATELYFYADDLEAAITRIVVAGALELSGLHLRAWGDEAAYFADLDGNVLVLARPVA